MKTNHKFKSAVAIAVIGAFLSACSGGGEESANSTKLPTKPNNNPNNNNPFVPSTPPSGSGPINVGVTGNETIDDIKAQNEEIMDKLDMMSGDVNAAKEAAGDAEDNSAWSKWLGVGIASALGLSMLYNGWRNGNTKDGFDFGKAASGFFFSHDNDKDEEEAQARHDVTAAKTSGAAAAAAGHVGALTIGNGNANTAEVLRTVGTVPGAVENRLGGRIDAAKASADQAGSSASDAAHNSQQAAASSARVEGFLQGKYRELETRLGETETSLKNAEVSIASLTGKLSAQDESLKALTKERDELKTAISDKEKLLQNNRTLNEKEINILRGEIAEMQKKAIALETRAGDLAKEVEALKADNKEKTEQIAQTDQVAALFRDLEQTAKVENFDPKAKTAAKWNEDLVTARGIVAKMPEGQTKKDYSERLKTLDNLLGGS